MMITSFIIVQVVQELSQHVLDIVQGLILSPRSFLLGLKAAMEVIIVIVICYAG